MENITFHLIGGYLFFSHFEDGEFDKHFPNPGSDWFEVQDNTGLKHLIHKAHVVQITRSPARLENVVE